MKKTAPSHVLLPPRLKRGDIIGLVSPAGPINDEDNFITGIRLLKDLGFHVKFLNNSPKTDKPYLAAPDSYRATEFEAMWRDNDVAAILAVRGGYGALRMVSAIPMQLLKERPKPFIGFSDITTLLTAIHKQTGLIVFHGPMLTTLAQSTPESIEAFLSLLTCPEPKPIKPIGLEILRNGLVSGKLLGGNLTSLIHLIATPYELSWHNAILFLEDVNEPGYRVDRMLTHLEASGRLKGIAGIILGEFKNCETYDHIWDRVMELTEDSQIPVWAAFPAGHGASNQILPMGLEVMMDSTAGLLRLLGPCVA